MLLDMYSRKEITHIPFRETFDTLKARLSQDQFEAVVAEINQRIKDAGDEIVTSSWLPGKNWEGTPFQPIYEIAAQGHKEVAAKMFGLMVWYTIMKRPDCWMSDRFQMDGRDLPGRTYFRPK